MNIAKIEKQLEVWTKKTNERLIWAKDFYSLHHHLGIDKDFLMEGFDAGNRNTFHLNEIQTKEVIDFIDNLYDRK